MRRLTVLALAALVAAGVLATTTTAGDDHVRVSGDSSAAVYVWGCEGLIADSGAFRGYLPDAHFFVASIHTEGWYKWPPETPWEAHTAHYRISGTGTDAAGHSFTIKGTLTFENGGFDFYANDGDVVVRRDDGASARGHADEGYPNVWGINDNVISVGNDQCRP
jgi:hypothetical protein